MAHLYISAAHKSSGKTTLSVGLAAALTRRGSRVQTFKKGPDYIDPLWLQLASDHPCYNLDFNTQNTEEIMDLFARKLADSEIGLIEGNKGLYDGVALDGQDSNAALAVKLQAPVILVIDVMGITRGIAPLLVGYSTFDPNVNIAGVIFNKVGSPRQEDKLRTSVERYTDISIVGSVPRDNNLLAPERHLGLVPPSESDHVSERITELAKMMEASLDIDQLSEMAQLAPPPPTSKSVPVVETMPHKLRIGIARDSAFGFYYQDDLETLENAGAELVFVNTLEEQKLPAIDGLFLGGGFPETHMKALQNNKSLRADIKVAAQGGLPVYAECGGLMYLSKQIIWRDEIAEMVGFIPGTVTMHDAPQGRGLVLLQETGQGAWPEQSGDEQPATIKAHEFHYASLEGLPDDTVFAHKVLRGHGIDGAHDGIVLDNVQAGFCHHRTTAQNDWAVRFVDFVRRCKRD
ncbi:MAG: hydrogenobyrinic acid a,c-diamide synthase (glutamine-hydrolyzing) [bacterium]|nr:hydrogenobyrinic acid a,c-diamide synthase (glutamine-hydrolyzing) [bacterium]